MKKLIFLFSILFATSAIAQETLTKQVGPPAGKAGIGDSYGAEFLLKQKKQR